VISISELLSELAKLIESDGDIESFAQRIEGARVQGQGQIERLRLAEDAASQSVSIALANEWKVQSNGFQYECPRVKIAVDARTVRRWREHSVGDEVAFQFVLQSGMANRCVRYQHVKDNRKAVQLRCHDIPNGETELIRPTPSVSPVARIKRGELFDKESLSVHALVWRRWETELEKASECTLSEVETLSLETVAAFWSEVAKAIGSIKATKKIKVNFFFDVGELTCQIHSDDDSKDWSICFKSEDSNWRRLFHPRSSDLAIWELLLQPLDSDRFDFLVNRLNSQGCHGITCTIDFIESNQIEYYWDAAIAAGRASPGSD
jgi:hypothetical protein